MQKKATKIYASIQNMLVNVKLENLMGASNIFGRGLGTKRIVLIMNAYPNILKSKLSNNKKIELISELEGFKEKTAKMFVPYIPKFLAFLKSINLMDKLKINK